MAAHGRSTPTPTRRYPPLVDVINPSSLLPRPSRVSSSSTPPPGHPASALSSFSPQPPPFFSSLIFSISLSLSSPVFVLQLLPSCRPSSSSSTPPVFRRKTARFQVAMDRKNASGSPPFPSPAPPSELHGAKGSSSSSSPTHNHSLGLFNSVFPPATPLDGRYSPKSDIFGPPPRKMENANLSWNTTDSTSEEGKYGYNPDKEHKVVGKDKISIYQSERTGPCSLSNSLYYGGQDICVQSPNTSYTNKKDDEDDPASSHFASRGNWWQGSLYY